MKRFLTILLACVFALPALAATDEGMWLYNAPPTGRIKAKYDFDLTQADRKSVV